MPTRFYLPSSGSAAVNFNGSSSWNNPASANPNNQHRTSTTPQNTALTGRTLAEAVASVINQSLKLYVSDPLDAQTISGTLSAVILGQESATTGDNALQVIVRVMSNDGQTQRAVLYAGQAAALNATTGALGQEFGTSNSTRIVPSGTALTSYTCVSGDRLSIELGYRSYDTSATSDSATITTGDPTGTADYALTAGLTTSLRPWVELSGSIAFTQDLGSIAGSAVSTGAVVLALAAALSLTGSATSSGSAAVGRSVPLAAAGASVSTGSAAVGVSRPLTMSGSATSSGTAALSAPGLTAAGSATSIGSVVLGVSRPLSAAGAATSSGSAAIRASIALVPAGSATATGTVTIGRTADLGALTGSADSLASLELVRASSLTFAGSADSAGSVSLIEPRDITLQAAIEPDRYQAATETGSRYVAACTPSRYTATTEE